VPRSLRAAQAEDVAQMVALSEAKRSAYAAYQPLFWRKAAGSAAVQADYFQQLLSRENILAFVAPSSEGSREQESGQLEGFIIAALVEAPAVYDPGGLTCLVDDFCVAGPVLWATTGQALLRHTLAAARARGAAQVVVVCGHLDEPKRAMLQEEELTIASEWYVKPLV
jgi:hypothetical protein